MLLVEGSFLKILASTRCRRRPVVIVLLRSVDELLFRMMSDLESRP